ncbi:cell filamentation protein Fic [Helicobacter sp. 16-1353]|uniref:protein adenylyltransferase Fic n=1 Tax=Helicobacter sp. 16-1353 TaxID=2004996 RepID=UPI000DCB1A66|nr:Fic family protein [Helicobacter sp. 16-1353]RAX52269.1 cell filamentation protein Fic [Helicobacter sp. 16-1353]
MNEVLENKLNIKSQFELDKQEELISKKRALRLFDNKNFISCDIYKFDFLAKIHKFLFEEIYHFAGQIRTQNISKGGFRFAPVLYINEAIKKVENMPNGSFDEIVEKYVEMNIIHPFREGNGRSMRIWLDFMMRDALKLTIEWSRISKADYMLAMERSPIKDTEIKALLKNALNQDIGEFSLFARNVDISYSYEGYDFYTSFELLKSIDENRKKI